MVQTTLHFGASHLLWRVVLCSPSSSVSSHGRSPLTPALALLFSLGLQRFTVYYVPGTGLLHTCSEDVLCYVQLTDKKMETHGNCIVRLGCQDKVPRDLKLIFS